ncbi:MAG: RNB domain-containing ribonuclease [Sphingomonas sp.]
MKTIIDADRALATGLAAIRADFEVEPDFPPEVIAAATEAARRPLSGHTDRISVPFVTLDPASSTDLDQAFAIDRDGNDLILHYAIADVAWFVADGDPIDVEAWKRGETLYLPDGKATLYPPLLSEGAASLLPDVERPAVIFAVRVAPDGAVRLDGAERGIIRSVAKLAYEDVTSEQLPPGFAELALRIEAAENARGAARVDPPEQEVARGDDGRLHLAFRPRLVSEDRNAALSLATNLAVADALQAHHTGLFRVMAAPDRGAIARLRNTARGFGLDWPAEESLEQFSKSLNAADPVQAAFMLEIRRAGHGASYARYREGMTPWHAAMAATYAHATAPLRRLADRYVVRAAVAIANGEAVPDAVTAAFDKLPAVMAHADGRAGQIEHAVIDLAEAVMLADRVGERFDATVVDSNGKSGQVQLGKLPVVVRVEGTGLVPGNAVTVRLEGVDVAQRATHFAIAD